MYEFRISEKKGEQHYISLQSEMEFLFRVKGMVDVKIDPSTHVMRV